MNLLVEAKGDLVASGEKSPGQSWTVGLQNPRKEINQLLSKLDVSNRAIATSSDYSQPFIPNYSQHHVLDPRTGYSSKELSSATVIAPDVMLADCLTTTLLVTGSDHGKDLIKEFTFYEALLLTKHLEIIKI